MRQKMPKNTKLYFSAFLLHFLEICVSCVGIFSHTPQKSRKRQKIRKPKSMVMIGGFYVRLPFSYKKSQKGTENYDESNGKKTGSTKKPGENFKENDGLSEESRADGQQKKNEPSHDQKGVKAYDEQKRIL